MNLDPSLVVYSIGGFMIVGATFIVLSLFTEGIRAINTKIQEEEKQKKEKEKERRSKAA